MILVVSMPTLPEFNLTSNIRKENIVDVFFYIIKFNTNKMMFVLNIIN